MANPQHTTLVPATVHTFILDDDYDWVQVASLDGTARVTFTVNGDTPVIDGDGGHVLPAAISALKVDVSGVGASVVKVISSGSPFISVTGC